MCYEQRFIKSWAKQKAQKREEIKPDVERTRPDVPPIRPAPENDIAHRKEVEREFEAIV